VFTRYRHLSLSWARLIQSFSSWVGRDSVVSVVTRYGLDNPGIDSGRGNVFYTRPDRWSPHSHLYNGYPVFFGGGVRGRGVALIIHLPSSAEFHERLELYDEFYIWASVHRMSIICNKPTRCNSGGIVFIKNYKYALHVSDALCVHLQEHYKL